MNKQIFVAIVLFAMVALVVANEYQQYHTEEKKFVSIPALKLKLNMDKLTFKLPNLGLLFQQHQEHRPSYPSY